MARPTAAKVHNARLQRRLPHNPASSRSPRRQHSSLLGDAATEDSFETRRGQDSQPSRDSGLSLNENAPAKTSTFTSLPSEVIDMTVDLVLLLQHPNGVLELHKRPLTSVFRTNRKMRHRAFNFMLKNFTFAFGNPLELVVFREWLKSIPPELTSEVLGNKFSSECIQSIAFTWEKAGQSNFPRTAYDFCKRFANLTRVAINVSHDDVWDHTYGRGLHGGLDRDMIVEKYELSHLFKVKSLREVWLNCKVSQHLLDEEGLGPLYPIDDMRQWMLWCHWQDRMQLRNSNALNSPSLKVVMNVLTEEHPCWGRISVMNNDQLAISRIHPEIPRDVTPCFNFVGR